VGGLSGFGFGEMLLIAMLVLIVFGPKRLPEITRTIGKGIREFKKGMNEIQRELEAAGREEKWSAPPPASSAAAAAGTATIAGAARGGESDSDDGGADEAESASSSVAATPAEPAPDEPGQGDPDDTPSAEATDEPGAGSEPHAPPVPRDHVDPADEFIDPWSTDSSRPTFSPTPAPEEPVIAPPDPPDAAEVADEQESADEPAPEPETE